MVKYPPGYPPWPGRQKARIVLLSVVHWRFQKIGRLGGLRERLLDRMALFGPLPENSCHRFGETLARVAAPHFDQCPCGLARCHGFNGERWGMPVATGVPVVCFSFFRAAKSVISGGCRFL